MLRVGVRVKTAEAKKAKKGQDVTKLHGIVQQVFKSSLSVANTNTHPVLATEKYHRVIQRLPLNVRQIIVYNKCEKWNVYLRADTRNDSRNEHGRTDMNVPSRREYTGRESSLCACVFAKKYSP